MKKVLLLLLVCSFLKSFSQLEEEESRVPGEYIVMLKPGTDVKIFLESVPSAIIKECLSERMNIWLFANPGLADDEMLLTLQRNKLVKLAQFNHYVKSRSLIPNDTQFSEQWNMLNTGQAGGLAGADIEATEAWAINNDHVTTNGDTVVVAIIDSRVQLTHPEINFFTNYHEIPANGIDDDGNGYIDDVNGWNADQNTGSVSGSDNHTMHACGVAAAKGNNGMGVAGVCWGAKVLPVLYGFAVESNVIKAFDYVRNMRLQYNNTFGTQGAFVVSANTSFGIDRVHPAAYPLWCAMYDSMGAVGILSSAATTNANWDVDVEGDMPTECPSNWLITVTNTTNTDIKSGAGWGKLSIDLGAPGRNVLSTFSNSSYGYLSGTSMSAPHVAGAIAAMYSAACKALIDEYHQYPDSVALLVKKYLMDGTEWISSLNNLTVTGGRLNLFRAISNLNRFNCDSCNFNFNLHATPITCRGSNDGSLSLSPDSGSISFGNILWSNGATDSQLVNLSPGFYAVTVTDSAGCSRQSTASLYNPDTIIFNAINIVPATDSGSGIIAVNATAGNSPLQYSLDNINYQPFSLFNVTSNGVYTVYVRSAAGCVAQQQVVLSSLNDVQSRLFEFSLFPNPADKLINIAFSSSITAPVRITVVNVLGEILFDTENEVAAGFYTSSLNLSGFQNGVYFLQVQQLNHRLVKRFVVAR